jgi:nucleotide-binding universal stress UspA family protein
VVAIVGASRHAGIVVLEHGSGLRRRIPTLSVTNSVAAHAHAPVAAVPAGWRGDSAGTGVVVGALGDAASAALVARCALAEGRARDARVRLVHAWRFDDCYDGIVLDGAVGVQYEEKVRRELTAALAPVLADHPGVPAELVVVHERPADVLVAESVRADLVVLGRHRSTVPWGPHLGSTVRAVLRESVCPVLVVDPETAPVVTNGPAAPGDRP